jgi:S1-C subfamily serine protease
LFLLIAGLLALATALGDGVLPRAHDTEIARGIRQVEQGDPQGGLETLDAALRRLSAAPGADDDLGLVHLYMGIAYAGLDQDKAARASFREALQRRRDLALDPQRFPRRTLRLFEEAQIDLPAETPAARAARSVIRLSAADGQPLAAATTVDTAGHALTVLSRLSSAGAVTASLPDGRRTTARVVGRDQLLNVALLALEAAPPPLELGDSDSVMEGARLAAVLAGQATVVEGVVQARDRAGTFLLTDLRLEQTASGSPLLDAEGRVVGLAMTDEVPVDPDPFTERFGAPGAAAAGAGRRSPYRTFAVPASALRTALPQLVELGRVRRGWLGLQLEATTEKEAKQRQLGTLGAIVKEVVPGGPAAAAGFLPGDQIVTLSGRTAFEDRDEVVRTIASLAPGTAVEVMVTRAKTNRILWLKATVGERPAAP